MILHTFSLEFEAHRLETTRKPIIDGNGKKCLQKGLLGASQCCAADFSQFPAGDNCLPLTASLGVTRCLRNGFLGPWKRKQEVVREHRKCQDVREEGRDKHEIGRPIWGW